MAHSTLSQTLSDSLWSQDQDSASRWIDASDCADRHAAALVATIAAQYDFRRDDEMTLLSASGQPLQVAMTLTHRFVASAPVTVVYDVAADQWLCYLPVPVTIPARAFIQAVKDRVEAAKAERFSREQEEDLQDFCADVEAGMSFHRAA